MTAGDYRTLSPACVLAEIARAVPDVCRAHIVIIGSLAVGYRYFGSRGEMVVRTKDADCLLSPRLAAASAGTSIANELLAVGWSFMKAPGDRMPGTATTPVDELPAVRLSPPGTSDWYLELLTVPEAPAQRGRRWLRVETSAGHMGLASFGFLALTAFEPMATDLGLQIARPEMMALANLLEHPVISKETMSAGFAGRADIRRSNKDLGRVIAIARLAMRDDETALEAWPAAWAAALKTCYVTDWRELAKRVGQGLRALLDSPADLEQAHFTCVNGLLNSEPPGREAFAIAGRRVLADAIARLEVLGTASG
jgi:hypothetical protein